MMIRISILLMTAVLSSGADDLPPIVDIIEEEGIFVFTDGSSTFQFLSDGSFFLEPAAISGRAVEGTWVSLGSGWMEISGTWTWYNGISAIDDHRSMTLYISLRSMDTEESELLWRVEDSKLYDVYFIIDELAKI